MLLTRAILEAGTQQEQKRMGVRRVIVDWCGTPEPSADMVSLLDKLHTTENATIDHGFSAQVDTYVHVMATWIIVKEAKAVESQRIDDMVSHECPETSSWGF